jgi:predicted DNA-binding ribbon-helix-helix protein
MSRTPEGVLEGGIVHVEPMKTTVFKRSVVVHGHKTSVSLEAEFWDSVREIAAREGLTISELLTRIDRTRGEGNLSSSIRLFVLQDLQARVHPALRGQAPNDKRGRN